MRRKKIDELSTRMLFDKRVLESYKKSDASRLIPDIIYPLKMAALGRKISNPNEKIQGSYYKTPK